MTAGSNAPGAFLVFFIIQYFKFVSHLNTNFDSGWGKSSV